VADDLGCGMLMATDRSYAPGVPDMLELTYEMTFSERIEGPLGPTTGNPSRLCWKIAEAALDGPRVTARLAMRGPTGSGSRTAASAVRTSEPSSSPATGR
jgi:hypothetical protein